MLAVNVDQRELERQEFDEELKREFQVPEWVTPDMQLVAAGDDSLHGKFRVWFGLLHPKQQPTRFRPYRGTQRGYLVEHVSSGLPLHKFRSWGDVVGGPTPTAASLCRSGG